MSVVDLYGFSSRAFVCIWIYFVFDLNNNSKLDSILF